MNTVYFGISAYIYLVCGVEYNVIHVCAVCIWRCEHACFCGDIVMLHLIINVHSLDGKCSEFRGCVKVEVAVLGVPVPKNRYGLCGRKATLNLKS